MRASTRTIGLATLVVTTVSCGVDLPERPDVETELSEYSATRPVEPSAVAAQVRKILDLVDLTFKYQLVRPTLRAVIEGVRKLRESSGGDAPSGEPPAFLKRLSINGVVLVHRRCPGWDSAMVDSEKAGFLEVALVVRDTKFDGGFIAEVGQCKPAPRLPLFENIELDGRLRVHFGNLLPKDDIDIERARPLFAFDGKAIEDGVEHARAFHFKANVNEEIEIPFTLPDGGRWIVRGRPGTRRIEIVGSETTWTCELDRKTCASDSQQFSW